MNAVKTIGLAVFGFWIYEDFIRPAQKNKRSMNGLGALKKYKWQPPYIGNKLTLNAYKGKSGVYLIRKGEKVVYVGYSGYNLYETIRRHFNEWNLNNKPYRNFYSHKGYEVRVILCTPAQAAKLEKVLILKYNPKDNELKYENYQFGAKDTAVWEKYKFATDEEPPF